MPYRDGSARKDQHTVDEQQAESGHEPRNGQLRQWMVAAIGCVLPPDSAVYVSTPITTGERYVRWRRDAGAHLAPQDPSYRDHLLDAVVAPNRAQVAPLVASLRARFSCPVIDPTALEDVPGWEQFDYHRYWTEVIERYVHTVVFAHGWEYSSGCVLELGAAVGAGAELLRHDLAPLAPADAVRRVERAIDDIAADGVLPEAPFRDALAALRPVLAGESTSVARGRP